MAKAERPFLIVNPKSYLYGQKSLELALAADKTAAETGLQIFFTCPYADIRLIRENTSHVVVCAQSLDPLTPGRGMGHVLPEGRTRYSSTTLRTLRLLRNSPPA